MLLPPLQLFAALKSGKDQREVLLEWDPIKARRATR